MAVCRPRRLDQPRKREPLPFLGGDCHYWNNKIVHRRLFGLVKEGETARNPPKVPDGSKRSASVKMAAKT